MYLIESTKHDYKQLYRLEILFLWDIQIVTSIPPIQSSKTNFNRTHKVDTKLDCHRSQTTLLCTVTKMETLPIDLAYFPSYNMILHSSRSMMTR